jgi:hypothetical protein
MAVPSAPPGKRHSTIAAAMEAADCVSDPALLALDPDRDGHAGQHQAPFDPAGRPAPGRGGQQAERRVLHRAVRRGLRHRGVAYVAGKLRLHPARRRDPGADQRQQHHRPQHQQQREAVLPRRACGQRAARPAAQGAALPL